MLTNYQQALLLIRELEEEYGSIAKVPETDSKMKQVHQLLPIGRRSEDKKYDHAIQLNYEGYSNAHIAQVTHHSKATIISYFKKHNIKQKQTFYYKVVAPDHLTTYYADSLNHLYKIIFNKRTTNSTYTKIHFLKKGYAIRTKKIIWIDIPNGSYYCIRNSSNLYIKNGIDSYMNSQA